jgi:hypothetical protein
MGECAQTLVIRVAGHRVILCHRCMPSCRVPECQSASLQGDNGVIWHTSDAGTCHYICCALLYMSSQAELVYSQHAGILVMLP